MKRSMLTRVLLRLLPRARRADIEGDLLEEASAIAEGRSERAARRWLHRELCGFLAQRIRHALGRGLAAPRSWLSLTDLRIGVRLARRQPVATTTAILALAAAIGLVVAGTTLLQTTLFNTLPIEGGDRVYQVEVERDGRRGGPVSQEIEAWLELPAERAILGVFQTIRAPIRVGEGTPTTVPTARVRPAAFATVSPAPILGRHLTPADARVGVEPVVVISEDLWRDRMAGAMDAIGQRIEVAGELHTLVGVLPSGWRFPMIQRAWLPLREGLDGALGRGSATVWVMLHTGDTPEPLRAELEGLIADVRYDSDLDDMETRLEMVPYTRGFAEKGIEYVMAALIGFLVALLLVVSLNVANLVLARTAGRSGEIAVRTALGAPRGRICAQLFAEVLVMGLAAAFLGTAGARYALGWLEVQVGAGEWPFWVDLGVTPTVVLTALALAVLASAVASLVPALKVTRGLGSVLQSGSRGQAPAAIGRLTSTLLAIELAASLGLLALALLLAQGLMVHDRMPDAYDPDRVLTASLYRDPAATDHEPTTEELYALRTRLERGFAEIPGVERVGLAMSLPRTHQSVAPFEIDDPRLAGRPRVAEAARVTPGFLDAVGVAPIQGRGFERADGEPDAPPVAVVSENFVQSHLGGRWAPGLRLRPVVDRDRLPDAEDYPWAEIIGVVPDLGLDPIDDQVVGEVYRIVSASNFYYATLRTNGDPMALAGALRDAVSNADPAMRVAEVMPLSAVGWETRAVLRGGGSAFGVFGSMALLLALAGIYSLASVAVSSRTREIGVRMALGASHGSILRTVLARSVRQLVAGALGGAVLALLLARATVVLPFSLPGSIVPAVAVMAALMVGAGLLASWIPARRALRIDPSEALRAE